MSWQVVGIDAGGSHTRAWARPMDGSAAAEIKLEDEGANYVRHGEEHTTSVLTRLLRKIQSRGRAPIGAVVAGVAGAGTHYMQGNLADSIRERLGKDAPPILEIVHDGVIALEAAFHGHPGTLIIAGTGSAVIVRDGSRRLMRAGGWGYLIGDEGSGFAIGRRGIAAVAHDLDGGPKTALAAQLELDFGGIDRDDILHLVYKTQYPLQDWAESVLFHAQRGDLVAETIVKEEAARLARQAARLMDRAIDLPPRVCLTGGLSQSAYYRQQLGAALHESYPDAEWVESKTPNVAGAVSLAHRLTKGPTATSSLRFSDSSALG